MLGEIDRGPSMEVDQWGDRALSALSIIRWPLRHAQSNAIHLGCLWDPTKTAPLRGSLSGTSSAASTTATIRHPNTGSHCHQGMCFTLAMSVPGRAASCRSPVYAPLGRNNVLCAEAQCWLKSPVRGSAIALRWGGARDHSRSTAQATRSLRLRQLAL